jgi:predicted dehydrogenase
MIHGYFENYASDEGLPADHWFWDISKSGGIFIEHGVHFFDMFEGWLGKGEVIGATIGKRPGTDIEEQVQATVRYQNNILVNFYHGFHQAGRMDRQEMKLVFEKGDVTLYEWIPTRMHINAILGEEDTKQLVEIFPDARLRVTESYGGKKRLCSGRHKPLDVYQKIFLTYGYEEQKLHIYSNLLLSMFKDQKTFLTDKTHERVITERNGYNSILTAVAADNLARKAQNAKTN